MADAIKRDVAACPDAETIAAFIDGRLSGDERTRVVEHLAECPDCYFIFSESARMPAATGASEGASDSNKLLGFRPAFRTLMQPRVLAGLAAAAAIVIAIRVIPWRSSSTSEIQALVAAVGTERTFEPRLTGGFAYGPVKVTRGPATEASPGVRLAAARIAQTAEERRTPETLRALGISYLVTGEVSRAVPVFEEAAADSSADARLLSDLSAAYLVRATRNGQAQDYTNALTSADRAVKADPNLAEAWFNRADALERLSLLREARQAWQQYLAIDGKSGWADEARNRLKAIDDRLPSSRSEERRHRIETALANAQAAEEIAAVIKSAPAVTQQWLETQTLVEWPRMVLAGQPAEARALASQTQRIAGAITAQRSDAFWQDVVKSMTDASARGSAERLARAHQAFQLVKDAYRGDRVRESGTLAAQAIEALATAESPLALAARRYHAAAEYFASHFPVALDETRAVQSSARLAHYSRLLGMAYRLEGLIHVVRGDFAPGIDAYEQALTCFHSIESAEDEAAIQSALAEAFEFVGDVPRSWQARYAALENIDAVGDEIAAFVIFHSAALAALREESPDLALHFQAAALEHAQASGRAPAQITAYLTRAAIDMRLGEPGKAEADLDHAKRALDTVKDPLLIARNEARILLARGETLGRVRPAEAVADIDRALEHFDRTRTTWEMASAYLARGRAHIAGRDEASAEADFLAGIQIFERLRSALTTESLRTSYFEQPWDLFTEMIRLQADRHDATKALMFAERARARTLLEAVDPASAGPPPALPEVRAALPPGVAVVYYASLDDRLLLWLVTRDADQFIATPTRHADLVRLVDRWRDSTTGTKPAVLAALYDLLIRPLDGRMPDGMSLVIVPDGVLHAVPFAALLRRETGRYLVQDHGIETSPSLTIFQRSAQSRRKPQEFTSALVVGNPRTDGGSLPDLPQAEREAREIGSLYAKPQLLLAADASKDRFMTLAPQFDVVHFAGHGISNDDYPALSRLMLSGADEASRSLFASDIAALRLSRTDLVVLAACRTSAGRIRRGEGVLSLARPFIAAGAPTVVASLWDADDRASRGLFVAFHRALRDGASVVGAMREAQLRALTDSDPVIRDPANWATFVVIGGASALRGSTSALAQ